MKPLNKNPNDIFMTPLSIAKQIIDEFYTSGSMLDPFAGEGAFYDQFPTQDKDWDEINKGCDFFKRNDKFDWIISNPPFSCFKDVLLHSFEIADNIVYLVPLGKIFSSMDRIEKIYEWGGIPKILIIGSGSSIGFPFGFPVAAVYFKKGYSGNTEIITKEQRQKGR